MAGLLSPQTPDGAYGSCSGPSDAGTGTSRPMQSSLWSAS